jgi:hypothetical protein
MGVINMNKEYITKCEKAVELQKDYEPTIGDLVYFNGMTDIEDMVVCDGDEWRNGLHPWTMYAGDDMEVRAPTKEQLEKTVWLPTQEQLQEMVMIKHNDKPCWVCTLSKFDRFTDFIIEEEVDNESICLRSNIEYPMLSITELWLAYVMWNKFKKTWNIEKEEWVVRE